MSKPRVLIFTETALAVSETFIANHCRSCERYEATLVVLYGKADHHSDVPIFRLAGDGKPGALQRLMFRLGHSKALDGLIDRLKPDIIHAHYLPNGVFMLPYARRHGIPLVVTVHGHDATRKLKRNSVYDQIYRVGRVALQRDAAAILPVSNFLRDVLVTGGFNPARLRTHYLGVPMGIGLLLDIEKTSPTILFVGRLVAKKGIDVVLDAFALIRRQRQDAELYIVGDGPLRGMVNKRATEIGGVIVHGAQPADITQRLMAEARLLVLPSRQAEDGDVEGFGLVLAEAQALGLAVVTANVGGTAEALDPGQTGFAVDPTDSAAVAAACLRLLGDPQLASEMGRRAYAHARQHFDLAKQTRKLEAIYDDLLARATVP